uniref:Uncharacterized protein n=1 Tax=Ditylenchus dipsaci TaxID=166011 RepID=A0A915CNN3_9BILA
MRFVLFTLLSLFSMITLGSGADITDDLKKAATPEEGEKWCPVRLAGTQCPASSIFHYYKCCGNLNNECCVNIQSWIIIVLIGLGVLVVASFLVTVLRCIFCRRK